MAFYKLSDESITLFDDAPELMMGIQIGLLQQDQARPLRERTIYLVIGGQIAMPVAGPDAGDPSLAVDIESISEQPWMKEDLPYLQAREMFDRWRSVHVFSGVVPPHRAGGLDDDDIGLLSSNRTILGYILNPYGYLPPTPPRPSHVFGHLLFSGSTEDNDVFYRYEHWPSSRRVMRATSAHYVLANTYCAPFSEAPFAPTGFAAVGRFALPTLTPAKWRYELKPQKGFTFRCGACVPLYGQAGGGVEAMFVKDTPNDGPIANPVVLPPL
jgi:hypothetical protein